MMPLKQNQAIVQQFATAFNTGNLSIIDELVDRNFYTHVPPPGDETARDVISQIAIDLRAAIPDLTIETSQFSEDEDETLTFTMTMSGTSRNELWGAPPSGKQVTWTARINCRFDNGQFSFRFQELSMPHLIGVLRQIDLVPPPEDMDKPMKYPVQLPEFVVKLIFTGQAADKPCSHLDQIRVVEPATDVCAGCVEHGDGWPALRMCLICGFVGCCDTAKHKHMKQHYEETGHGLFRSIRMQESWVWCYDDNAFFSGRILEQYR